MSQPVFGRQPSRPLRRDGDSEPTEELEIDLSDDQPEAARPDTEPEAEPAALDDESAESGEPGGETEAEAEALDVEGSESGEPGGETEAEEEALDVEGSESGEPGGETEAEEPDREPVVLDVEELAPTQPGEPVVVDAEAVSAEPHRADGDEGAWVEIQAQFVDDPQAATAGALRMLRERLDDLAPAGASTEDLRVAFRRYRAAWFDLGEK
jgi:hypothetical protein